MRIIPSWTISEKEWLIVTFGASKPALKDCGGRRRQSQNTLIKQKPYTPRARRREGGEKGFLGYKGRSTNGANTPRSFVPDLLGYAKSSLFISQMESCHRGWLERRFEL